MFCSIVLQTANASYSGGNHLSTEFSVLLSVWFLWESSPTKFGFLARGVYRVPLSPFLVRLRHCGTFKDTLPYPKKDVGIFPAVSLPQAALAYFFARHEHYGHLSTVRAWTFLCNALNSITAITRTLINKRYYKRQWHLTQVFSARLNHKVCCQKRVSQGSIVFLKYQSLLY